MSSTQNAMSVWYKTHYLRKWPLCLRHYSMYSHNCIQMAFSVSVMFFSFFFWFFPNWGGACLPVCGKARLLLPAEAGGVLPPATSLLGVSSVVTNHPQPSPSDGLGATWPLSKSRPDSAHLCSSQQHPSPSAAPPAAASPFYSGVPSKSKS